PTRRSSDLVSLLQHGPCARASVHITDITFVHHCIEYRRRTPIPDPQMPLQERRRSALGFHHTFQRIPEKRIAPARQIAAVRQLFIALRDRRVILRPSLRLYVLDDLRD